MDGGHYADGTCPALHKYSKAAAAMRSTSASFLASVKSEIAAKRLCCSFHACNGSKLTPQLRFGSTRRKIGLAPRWMSIFGHVFAARCSLISHGLF